MKTRKDLMAEHIRDEYFVTRDLQWKCTGIR